jgi:hypothetical protein
VRPEHVAQAGQHVLHVDVDLLDVPAGDDLEGGKRPLPHLDLHLPLVEPPLAELLAQPRARAAVVLARRVPGGDVVGHLRRRQQQVEQPLLGGLLRLLADLDAALVPHHPDRELRQVANHRLDVASHVPDLGELRGLDLQEGGVRQLREAARDLGLAHAGRPDHQDVLRGDVFGQLRRQLLPARAIPERDRHGALRLLLADHVAIELAHNLAGRQRLGGRRGRLRKVDGHRSEFFDRDRAVGVDADPGGDPHRLFSDGARLQRRVLGERLGRRHGVCTTRSNRDDAIVGFDEVAGARQQERAVPIQDDQHRLEATQEAVRAPVARELDGAALQVAAILLQLRLEAGEQREGIGRRPRKTRQDLVIVQPPDLPRAVCFTTVLPNVTCPSPAMTA